MVYNGEKNEMNERKLINNIARREHLEREQDRQLEKKYKRKGKPIERRTRKKKK